MSVLRSSKSTCVELRFADVLFRSGGTSATRLARGISRGVPIAIVLPLLVSAPSRLSGDLHTGFPSANLTPALLFVEAPVTNAAPITQRFPKGSRLVSWQPGQPANTAVNLAPRFFAAADPDVSPSGEKILFSAKTALDSPWQVWEMNSNGTAQHQLTHCPDNCLKAAYLPENQFVYTRVSASDRESFLCVARIDGSGSHRITFGPGRFQLETVLQDGRLLASAERSLSPTGGGPQPRALFTMRPDGSGLTSFGDNRPTPLSQSAASELDDGTVVFTQREPARNSEPGGVLAFVRPGSLGVTTCNSEQPLVQSVHEFSGGHVLVSRQDSASSSAHYSAYDLDLSGGAPLRLIYRDPLASVVQAVPLRPHPAAAAYRSILHLERTSGRFICLNARRARDAKGGTLSAAIAQVRVFLQKDDKGGERLLGQAPVAADGSFYIAAPADRPVRFDLVAANGDLVASQKSWIWVRPGEDRGCIGCHEDKAESPQNHWPLALSMPGMPARIGLPPQKTLH